MQSSPNQSSPGKQLELRVTASNLELDGHMAAQTIPEYRQVLPGYLHFYSEHISAVSESDQNIQKDLDRANFSDTQLQGLLMKVSRHTLNKFTLTPNIEKVEVEGLVPEWRLKVELQLGLEAAKAILVKPFFTDEARARGVIPMYYTIPNALNFGEDGSADASDAAMLNFQKYLDKEPRGIVDTLMLVTNAARNKTLRTRTRVIPVPLSTVSLNNAPIVMNHPREVVEFDTAEDYGYDKSIESAS